MKIVKHRSHPLQETDTLIARPLDGSLHCQGTSCGNFGLQAGMAIRPKNRRIRIPDPDSDSNFNNINI